MQVIHAMSEGPASFRNTWLQTLAIRLPVLALAVDDAFVAFAERIAALLAAPSSLLSRPQSGAQMTIQVVLLSADSRNELTIKPAPPPLPE